MQNRLRWVIVGEAMMVGLMVIFHPFHVVYAPGVIIRKGYGFILNPPKFQNTIVSTVDISLLFVQIAVVISLGALYYYVLTKPE